MEAAPSGGRPRGNGDRPRSRAVRHGRTTAHVGQRGSALGACPTPPGAPGASTPVLHRAVGRTARWAVVKTSLVSMRGMKPGGRSTHRNDPPVRRSGGKRMPPPRGWRRHPESSPATRGVLLDRARPSGTTSAPRAGAALPRVSPRRADKKYFTPWHGCTASRDRTAQSIFQGAKSAEAAVPLTGTGQGSRAPVPGGAGRTRNAESVGPGPGGERGCRRGFGAGGAPPLTGAPAPTGALPLPDLPLTEPPPYWDGRTPVS